MLPQRWAILYLSLFLLQLTPAARGSDPHTVSRVLVDLRNRSQQIPEKAPNSEQSSTAEVGRGGAVRSEAGNTEEVKAESVNPVVTGQKLEERLIAALHRRYKGDLGGSKGKDEHYSLPELAEDEVLLAEKILSRNNTKDGDLPYNSYELVLARVNEEISWIADLPDFWRITVYNKGGEFNPVPEVHGRKFDVVNLPNEGREGETFMHHIWLRYDTLSDYTVFSQAIPFVHSPHFVDLLKDARHLRDVQCLSLVYISEGNPEYVTPKEVVETYRKHEWFRAERLSLRTLDSVYFNDKGSALAGRQYLEEHHLPPGTNIIAHFLSQMGLPGWIPNENELGSFSYGGLVGAHKSKILQHPVNVYENLGRAISASPVTGFVMEKTYLLLFGGPNIRD